MSFFVWHKPYSSSALEMGQEARIIQVDFSAAFDWVNQQEILFKLCSVGVGGSVLSVLTQLLSNGSQYVVVDGCRSKKVKLREVLWARSCSTCTQKI